MTSSEDDNPARHSQRQGFCFLAISVGEFAFQQSDDCHYISLSCIDAGFELTNIFFRCHIVHPAVAAGQCHDEKLALTARSWSRSARSTSVIGSSL